MLKILTETSVIFLSWSVIFNRADAFLAKVKNFYFMHYVNLKTKAVYETVSLWRNCCLMEMLNICFCIRYICHLVVGVSWNFPTDRQSAGPTDYHRLIGSSHFHENVCLSKLKFCIFPLIIILYYFKLSILSWYQTFSGVFDLCYEGFYM